MAEKGERLVKIDLDQFKMHIQINENTELSLHFDSPSRSFYLSVIALVVHEMQKLGRMTSIPLEEHSEPLALLNETVGGLAGSSQKKTLLPRIYKKWKGALPDLENAPLFRVLGKTKEFGDAIGRTYRFSEEEKDRWANLFEYKGSGEKVRLRFSVDKLGGSLSEVVTTYREDLDQAGGSGWDRFLETHQKIQREKQAQERIRMEPSTALGRLGKWAKAGPRWFIVAASSVVFVLVIAAIWGLFFRESPPPTEPASVEEMAFPLPDKPSIAVLPFTNMNEDPKQEYFSDGLTEEIISALSRLPRLLVIARNSTFTYKGKPVKVQQVSEELGVRYVLEGSVRKAGDRVRITAQLVDAITGHHLWSERYDRPMKDIFALQDEITKNVIVAMEVKLTTGEAARFDGRGTDNLDAYLKMAKGWEHYGRATPDDYRLAREFLKEAIALDPEYATPYAVIGEILMREVLRGRSKSPQRSIEQAFELAQKAITLDESGPNGYVLLSQIYHHKGQHEKAMAAAKRAVSLKPNGIGTNYRLGRVLIMAGRPEEAIPYFEWAIRANPLKQWSNLWGLSTAYWAMGRYEEALTASMKLVQIRPKFWLAYMNLTACYAALGREEEAHAAGAEVLRLNPKFSLQILAKRGDYFMNQAQNERFIDALRKAGFPD